MAYRLNKLCCNVLYKTGQDFMPCRKRSLWLIRTLSTSRNLRNHGENREINMEKDILHVYHRAVDSVLPQAMVKRALQVENSTLTVDGTKYNLDGNVHIVAFGKAVAGMIRAAEDVLGGHVQGGIASIPMGTQETFKRLDKLDLLPLPDSKVNLLEGAVHNLVDENAHKAAMKIHDLVKSLGPDDIALTLISGGGSTLLPAPIPPITIKELLTITKLMFSHGASITQVNTVRKQLELLKGGGLAYAAAPAKVISLVLSDVINDPLDFIASGPTFPDYSSPQQCMDLFNTLSITQNQIPPSVIKVLQERIMQPETEETTEEVSTTTEQAANSTILTHWDCRNVQNVIVGSNKIAVKSAETEAAKLGYIPYVLSTALQGEAQQCGLLFSNITTFLCRSMSKKSGTTKNNSRLTAEEIHLIGLGISKQAVNDLRSVGDSALNTNRPVCVIGAGETTVNVTGTGVGGRCQEMALSCATHLHTNLHAQPDLSPYFSVHFLSAGTDGQDGPCDAAGALVNSHTVTEATTQDLKPEVYLDNNNTYRFFRMLNNGNNQVVTGLTGTNVMDLQVLMIQPKLW